ncbi:hypothetical protein MCOR13_008128 [Pyricularia oryzae]|nr:hypothetical protein MCOR13_008128 [Pyricularia oryzae]
MASSINASPTWPQGQLPGLSALASLDLDRSTVAITLAAIVILPLLVSYIASSLRGEKVPVVNPPGRFQTALQKSIEFGTAGFKIFQQAQEQFPNQPFKLLSNAGYTTILPPDRALEVKQHPNLSFRKAFSTILPASSEGAAALGVLDHPSEIIQKIVTKHLTKRLNSVTAPLSLETSVATDKNFGKSSEWTEIKVYEPITDVIARVSSRVFLGDKLCRDAAWLDITKSFAQTAMAVIMTMRAFPTWIRPLVFQFASYGKEYRALYRRGHKAIMPIMEERQKERAECAAKGVPAPVYNDLIEWAETEAGNNSFDMTAVQLSISMAAIHTTSDLVSQNILWLSTRPDFVDALRKEMIEVLPAKGWKKTSLTSLRLLDSAIKEAQRLKPTSVSGMQRLVMKDTVLEGGITLRKGEYSAVDATRVWDPKLHKNPDEFDIYRFYEARKQPGGEHVHQLVSTSPDHIAFGLGKYACPGRFFASNETKVVLCHLLLKYDWKLAEGSSTDFTFFGTELTINPETKVLYRRRKEEFDLDALATDEEAS